MKIKKYIVRDMQEAIKLIRDDMGPEAVIVSSYPVPRRGFAGLFAPRQIEVTAALDEPPKLEVQAIAESPRGDDSTRKLLEVLSAFQDKEEGQPFPALPDQGREDDPDGEDISPAFGLMLKKEGKIAVRNELFNKWRRILYDLEIKDKLIDEILSGLPEVFDNSEEKNKALLTEKITKLIEPCYVDFGSKKINVLVGPAGVGKTLTAVKMAAFRAMRENKKVALVSLNGSKVGSLVELKYYGSLIQAPVDAASNGEELAGLLTKYAEKDFIFIDAAGVSPNDTGGLLKMKDLLETVETEMDVILVMSSTTRFRDLKKCVRGYKKIGFDRMVFTKLDETETLGTLLNLVKDLEKPVAYVTFGQKVPDDIVAVTPKKLAGLVIGGADRYAESGFDDSI
ncbi:MAG: hypothetical protein VR69_11580 [Peptococcaceae bacterium BRH_c4b]|nr:MAG: hypothetical protein VR69_11580 [Peptococcaceae bacterium BRH_c4b]